ncbi:MAG: glycoside hydrolase family 5 protein [Treponema sp.]|nr:glycoside hydrolase family 5 protein [Candidatus Treponema scatequi]
MKKHLLKIQTILVCIFLLSCELACAKKNENSFKAEPLYSTEKLVVDTGSKSIASKTASQIVADMGFGWNLGNTLDAYTASLNGGLSTENAWGMPTTKQEMIRDLKQKGIKTIRIPISWHCHITDRNYTIDQKWMNRVKQIVDWAIEEDMYVVINCHHDNSLTANTCSYGSGYYPTKKCSDESKRFLYNIWSQIVIAFNNGYDEHLIFETMNEPRLANLSNEWWFNSGDKTGTEATKMINEYNQLILDVIRKSGGNNATRVVMFPSYAANPQLAMYDCFEVPHDTAKDRLALSAHMYTPYRFAMGEGTSVFDEGVKSELDGILDGIKWKFQDEGIPVVIGEMGATNKNNDTERAKWFTYFVGTAKDYGMSCIVWDNMSPNNTQKSERYGYYNRRNLCWYFPEIIQAAIDAAK